MKNKEIAAMVFVILMASAFALANIAIADVTNIPTKGEIPPTAYPPVIKWKWELPDDDPSVSCCQVTPVAGGLKDLTAYFVATDPEGASNIASGWIRVFYPNESQKVSRINAVKISVSEAESAIDAGVLAGCIPSDVAADMKSELEHGEAVAFKAVFTMYYYEPPGTYTVRAFVTDDWGNEVSYDNTFVYYELKAFAIDFDDVNFGVLRPCYEKIISGDTNMSTPEKPTIRNIGNVPIYIKVHFSEMTGLSDPTHKITGTFDAKFKGEKVYLNASEWRTFTNTLDVLETQYMDFSLHPPYGTPVDTYTGTLDIMIVP